MNTVRHKPKNKQWLDWLLTWHTVGHTVHPAGITELCECSGSGCSVDRPHTANSLEGRPHTHRLADWQRNPPDTLTHMFAVRSGTALEEEERINITARKKKKKRWISFWCNRENVKLLQQVWECTDTKPWLTDLLCILYTGSSLLRSRTHRTGGSPHTRHRLVGKQPRHTMKPHFWSKIFL